VGFITRGQGISVHREDCPNYLNSLREDRENRWIHVEWADTTTGAYSTTLRILARDRNGLVLDVATVLNSLSAKVLSLNARGLPDGNALILVTLEVADLTALRIIIGRLRTLSGVRQIERGNG
jgi:GTP pyrophosphokinase